MRALHWADGLVGQPLAPFTELFEANQPDFLLLVCASADNGNRLDGELQRILGITELNGARSRLGVAGICMLGPNMLQRACTPTSDADPELDLVAVAEQLADNGERLHVGQVRTWRRYGATPPTYWSSTGSCSISSTYGRAVQQRGQPRRGSGRDPPHGAGVGQRFRRPASSAPALA